MAQYIDDLAKPLGGLGYLEKMVIRISRITGALDNRLEKKAMIVMCSDNGVFEEGIASTPKDVTRLQAINMVAGKAAIGVMCKSDNIDLQVIDVGIDCDNLENTGVINRKIKRGTENIVKGPAMSRDEAIGSIEIGIEAVERAVSRGADIIGTGEMGIANTTTSSVVLMTLLDCTVDECVGRGSGLLDDAFLYKKEVVKKAIEINKPDKNDPLDVLLKVGGFDIGGLIGFFGSSIF